MTGGKNIRVDIKTAIIPTTEYLKLLQLRTTFVLSAQNYRTQYLTRVFDPIRAITPAARNL